MQGAVLSVSGCLATDGKIDVENIFIISHKSKLDKRGEKEKWAAGGHIFPENCHLDG